MAKPVNWYEGALGTEFPTRSHIHNSIFSNNRKKLEESLKGIVGEKLNTYATGKKLHPLHLCAMLNRLEMAQKLLATRVCEVNPEDYCKYTPLHHAAVGNFREMIALLLDAGADPARRTARGGTYLQHMQIVHPQLNPALQVFHYKSKEGPIVKGTGEDFKRLTKGAVFLEKEATLAFENAVGQWDMIEVGVSKLRPQVIEMLRKAYEVFLSKSPLLYVEERREIGLSLCAGEDIEAGSIVTEFLGEDQCFAEAFLKMPVVGPYSFTPFDGSERRGIASCMNDGFPNVYPFTIPNIHGLLKRVVFFATERIPTGAPIIFDYGVGDQTKFLCHLELREEEMLTFFKQYSHFSVEGLIAFFTKQVELFTGQPDRVPSASEYDLINKFSYLASTPHAILKLVCEEVLTIEALTPLCSAIEKNLSAIHKREVKLTLFLPLVQEFSDALKEMEPLQAQQWRKKVLEALTTMDVKGLVGLIEDLLEKPVDQKIVFINSARQSEAEIKKVIKEALRALAPPPPPKTQKEIEWDAMLAKCLWKDGW